MEFLFFFRSGSKSGHLKIVMGDFSSDEECGEEVSKVTEKDKHVTLVS